MPIIRFLLSTFVFLFSLPLCAQAASPFEEGNKLVKTTILQDRNEFQPSNSDAVPAGYIGIKFDIEPGWHIYWSNSGESGQPTALNWVVPEMWRVGDVIWPTPTKFIERGNIITYGYEGSLLLTVPIFNPLGVVDAPSEIEVQASSAWLVCKDICVPGQRDQSAKIIYSTQKALTPSTSADQFNTARESSPQQLPSSVKFSFDHIDSAIELSVPANPSSTVEEVAKSFQFFPFNSESLNFTEAVARQSGANTKIIIPVAAVSKKNSGPVEIGGVLATASGTFGNPTPASYSLNLNLSADDVEGIPVKRPPVSGTPLQFKVVHHDQDAAKKDPLPPHSQLQKNTTSQPGTQPTSLIVSILLAFLAGIILNVMPCVLPVLSIKVISLSLHRDLSRIDRVKYSLSYLAGIQFTFIVLALVVASLRQIGMEVGWGFQFQQPLFVYALSIVVFAFSLGFFDYYFVTIPGAQLLDGKVSKLKSPALKSFGEGILITLLSTPCTAPFLGTALAFAFSQSTLIATLVFVSIGFGLALPYLLVAAIPTLAEKIPRPGHWMRSVKELMGFLLLGTVIWLIYVLDALSPGSAVTTLTILLWLSFLVWFGRHTGKTSRWKFLKFPVLLLLIGVPAYYLQPKMVAAKTQNPAPSDTEWRPFSHAVSQTLLSQNKYVFIDFTADWCITCKFNERVTLGDSSVKATLERLSFVPLKANWTDGDKEITEALESYGGHGVPLYVMLSPDGRTEVLPTILTPGLVVERAEAFAKNVK